MRRLLWLLDLLLAAGLVSEFYRDGGWRGLFANVALVVLALVTIYLVSPPLSRWAESRWRSPKKDGERPVLNLTED